MGLLQRHRKTLKALHLYDLSLMGDWNGWMDVADEIRNQIALESFSSFVLNELRGELFVWPVDDERLKTYIFRPESDPVVQIYCPKGPLSPSFYCTCPPATDP